MITEHEDDVFFVEQPEQIKDAESFFVTKVKKRTGT